MYFKEFAQISDDFFVDGVVYRTDFNELMVTLPYNDIRAVNNILKNYITHLEEYQVTSIPYEQFQVKMGVLRYPVVTNQTNVDMILKFIDIAKEKAKLRKIPSIINLLMVIMRKKHLNSQFKLFK